MFHIKICGVRLEEEIDAAGQSQADAVGLNFYAQSVRYLNPAEPSTRRISERAADRGLVRVGVFVDETSDAIIDTAKRIGLDVIQLHGSESLDDAHRLTRQGFRVLRAVKLPVDELTVQTIASKTQPWREVGISLLLDADPGPAHGGSGQQLDWNTIREWSEEHPGSDWVLAGGLTPENIAEAIQLSGARRVDVASGVEEVRGKKSAALMKQFASIARHTINSTG